MDFYSGIIYQAMRFPPDMFTVLFTLGRAPGWLAQWNEMVQDGDLPANFATPYWPWEALKERLAAFGAVSLGFGAEEEESALGRSFVPAPRYSGHLQDALADLAELQTQVNALADTAGFLHDGSSIPTVDQLVEDLNHTVTETEFAEMLTLQLD